MSNHHSFSDFIRSHGYEPKYEIIAGRWVRFGRKLAISAKLYDDGLGGYLHDWRTGEKHFWFANTDALSPNEYARRKAEAEALKQVQKTKQESAYAIASRLAKKCFDEALQAHPEHPYLLKKKVQVHGIKQAKSKLLIPIYSVLGDMQSIQTIDAYGNKQFLKGGKISGGCHFIGEIVNEKPIFITEGYATAASVHEDTKCLTLVAFNAANLINVATNLRMQLPNTEIVIAGDADPVGLKYAELAANAIHGTTLIPSFGDNPDGYSDWNDYFNFWATE
jgi:putative DNA primase/helicase